VPAAVVGVLRCHLTTAERAGGKRAERRVLHPSRTLSGARGRRGRPHQPTIPADIGFIASGSVALRYNRCGKTYCGCHADPPRLHGPYWHFTAKVDNKTVNKRLSAREARLYEQWIANDRTVRALLGEMRAVAAEAQLTPPERLDPYPDHSTEVPGPQRANSSPRAVRPVGDPETDTPDP